MPHSPNSFAAKTKPMTKRPSMPSSYRASWTRRRRLIAEAYEIDKHHRTAGFFTWTQVKTLTERRRKPVETSSYRAISAAASYSPRRAA